MAGFNIKDALTESERADLERKRSPEAEPEYEGYDIANFANLNDDFKNDFGQAKEPTEQTQLTQNMQPQKPQQQGPQGDIWDKGMYYGAELIKWLGGFIIDFVKIIKDVILDDRILLLRVFYLNLAFMVLCFILDFIPALSFNFRINIGVGFIFLIFYAVLVANSDKGGIKQLLFRREEIPIIFGSIFKRYFPVEEIVPNTNTLEGDFSFLDDEGQGTDEDDEIVYIEDSSEEEQAESSDVEETDFDFENLSDEDINFDFSALNLEGADEDTSNDSEVGAPAVMPAPKIEVESDGRLTRKRLFDLMLEMLPNKTPEYSTIIEYEEGSDEFQAWEGLILKALSSATKKQLVDVDSKLVYVRENTMTVFLEMTRIHGFTATPKIREEIAAFVSKGDADSGVSVQVVLSGNNYKVTILKDVRPVIFLKDALLDPKVSSFLLSSRAMPIVVGVDEYAKPELLDLVSVESCISTGLARSGKSKSLTSKFWQVCALNSPKDVQFIIFDPKNSELFVSMSLAPHVAGLHGMETGLDALRDIVEKEGEYRKSLLKKNRVNNIGGFNKKFPKNKLPYIWVIVDEIMTIREHFISMKTKEADPWKEFSSLLTIIFTQLPYVGIKMWGISHRLQSVLGPNLVQTLSYKEAIRSSSKTVEELLGDDAPDIKLKYPGDTALWYTGSKGKYVKSLLVSWDEDDENKNAVPFDQQEGYLWKALTQIFYDIGFTPPDRRRYGVAFNRPSDEEIKIMLEEDGSLVPEGLDDDILEFDIEDDNFD